MSSLYEHYPIAMWIIDGVLWAIGLLCWIATYIGAPLESRKRGYHVSGVPGVAFVFFLLAGFFSPNKWLMLTALLDFSLTYLPVFLLKEHLKKGKSEGKRMKLKGEALKFPGMYIFDSIMRRTFGRSVKLVSYYGPVQMCVFGLEYEYKPKNYKFKVECERGTIQIEIYNEDGLVFCPWFVYPETRRVHYIDKGGDMEDLVQSTYRAIQNEEIIFLNQEEWADMCRKIEFD